MKYLLRYYPCHLINCAITNVDHYDVFAVLNKNLTVIQDRTSLWCHLTKCIRNLKKTIKIKKTQGLVQCLHNTIRALDFKFVYDYLKRSQNILFLQVCMLAFIQSVIFKASFDFNCN